MSEQRLKLRHLRRFVRYLGWEGLGKCGHRLPPEFASRRLVWYEWGTLDSVLLQINTCPRLCIAVYALRYRICSGWHPFACTETAQEQHVEAARLDGYVHVRWFASPRLRREFRQRHPECAGYSWERIRDRGLPY